MVDNNQIQIPLTSASDANSYSFGNWQYFFKKVFSGSNTEVKAKGFSNNTIAFATGYINSHITQDLGELAEHMRESDKDRVVRYISSMIAWNCALANELNFDLHAALWEKYPGYCKYCGEPDDCADAWWTSKQTKTGKKPSHPLVKGRTAQHEPQSLNGWVELIDKLYGRKYKIGMSLSDIMYKLYEENAEVLEALHALKLHDKESFNEVKSEVADFLTWVFALMIKLDSYCYLKKTDLSKFLFDKFQKGCVRCQTICVCKPNWLK